MDEPLVTVITPVRNEEQFLAEAIRSVLEQDHKSIQFLIGNDGSTDRTLDIIRSFNDPRIELFDLKRSGLSSTKNLLLEHARGDYVCFFDGDDVMPAGSISERLKIFRLDPDLTFVDGRVITMDRDLKNVLAEYVPTFTGFPFDQLIAMKDNCFFGNTWMIKRGPGMDLRFDLDLTHAEDLMFYLTISRGRRYAFTRATVLLYRRTGFSTMTNVKALEEGYARLVQKIDRKFELGSAQRWKIKRFLMLAMPGAYLKKEGAPFDALRSFFRFLFI